MLTEQQIHHFKTFGFLIFRGLFNPDELQTMDAEFERKMEASYQHAPFDGSRRHMVTMMGSETPFFATMLEDPRFCETAEQLYGGDVFGMISDANRYVGDTPWHPDTKSLHQYGVKFAYYLEPVDAETGALRVIPGSHKANFHNELREARSESRLDICEVPSYICTSEPGDVVAFDLRLWHASSGGSSDRRMCTLVYYNYPKTPEEKEAARDQAIRNTNTAEKFNRPYEPHHSPDWVANHGGNPRRGRWIKQMRELGFIGSVPS